MSRQRQTTVASTAPTGTLIRNKKCHENCSVSHPPSVGPIVGAMVAVRPISTETRLRRAPWNNRKEVANTVGIIAPPMKPCAARKAIISPKPLAPAQPRENSVNPTALTTNKTRVDNNRDNQPDSGIMTISAIK